MISFSYETDFALDNEKGLSEWLSKVIISEGFSEGEIMYIFCNDDDLLKLNIKHLRHNTLTDIISFDYTVGRCIHGDIFISVDRIRENSHELGINFYEELRRVMVHGILHYCGYKDKNKEEIKQMREKENYYIRFH